MYLFVAVASFEDGCYLMDLQHEKSMHLSIFFVGYFFHNVNFSAAAIIIFPLSSLPNSVEQATVFNNCSILMILM